jgi:hypothetical protein
MHTPSPHITFHSWTCLVLASLPLLPPRVCMQLYLEHAAILLAVSGIHLRASCRYQAGCKYARARSHFLKMLT